MRRIITCTMLVVFGLALSAGAVVEDKSGSPGPSNVGSSVEATGGPDDYGYVFADNAEAACEGTYSYVNITSTGTAAGLAGLDDDYAGPFPMGFSFDFYGTAHTDFYVGTNGVVYFEDAYLGLGNVCPLPATQSYTPQVFIGVYHDDLVVQSDGEVYYQTYASCPVGAGGGQCTVIQFYNMEDCCGTPDYMDFEVVLFANGTVIMQYLQTANDDASQTNGASATVGLQGTDASPPVYAIEYSCNTPSLAPDLAVIFAPPTAQTSGIPNECVVPVDLVTFTTE